MTRNEVRIPKRRFKEFESAEAWEQRKFIELLDSEDGIRRGPFGSSLKKDCFVTKSKYVVYEQQNAIYDRWETRYYITKEKYNELYNFDLAPGDFIMSGAGTIGRIARVPEGIRPGVFNQALIRFKLNLEIINSEYFLKWIRSEAMQRQFTQANPGSAMANLVPMSEVKKWRVFIPTSDEQKKIGNFFKNIDDMITMHQRKLEKLKALKTAYLAEMFPSDGESKPKLRFKGFADDWEQRELGDLASHRGGTALEKYFDSYGKYKVISIGSYGLDSTYIDQGIRVSSNEVTDSRVVCSGELTMVLNDKTASGAIIGRSLLIRENDTYVINQRTEVVSPKKNLDSEFAYVALNGIFREKVKKVVQGGTQIYVNYPSIAKLTLILPSWSEQRKIGDFFKTLDDTIAIHQRKLEKLQNIKQAYLNEMFV